MAKKKKSASKKKAGKRKPNKAFMKPMKPSAFLAAIVGSKPLPRTQVTKKIWAYIHRKKLQDKVKRTMIKPDAVLKKVVGGKSKIDMFQMTKWVNKHLK
jgi:chromatin remodeling complex protein RSC6